ncbi:MAG: CPBP family intramembrane metalloprotease [Saprospiraceae bacterium]|nr:CPBP family intramembrane metalloprotease [Saprospiraceae bacterium]
MQNNFYFKILSLIAILIGGLLCSDLMLKALAYLNGITISSEKELIALLIDGRHSAMVKGFVTTSHLLVFTICPLIFLSIFYKHNIKTHLKLSHFNPVFMLLFPLALFSLFPLIAYITFYIDQIDFPDYMENIDKDSINGMLQLLKMDSLSDLLVNLFMVGLLPGIGEELLFRGVIQNELIAKFKKPHTAIWITAILFSAFHFQIAGFLPKMMIGLVLGYAYHLSGSLFLPIFIHALNNSFATVALFFAGGKMEDEAIPRENIPIATVLLSTIICGLLMYNIYTIAKKDIMPNE